MNHTGGLLTQVKPTGLPTTSTAPLSNTLLASFTTAFAVINLMLNGLILASFLKRPSLRTPFSCYVVNLAVIDALSALIPMPSNVVKQIFGQWPFNGFACSIFLYFSQICNAANRAAHLLIAGNRLWAVSSPLSYRQRHTKRLAVGVILSAWSLTAGIVTPQVIIARRYVNHSLSAGDPSCALDTTSYRTFHMVFNVIVFNLPEIAIVIAYLCLVLQLRRKVTNQIRSLPAESSRHDRQPSTLLSTLGSKTHMDRLPLEEDLPAPQVTKLGPGEQVVPQKKRTRSVDLSHQPRASGQGEEVVPGQVQSTRRNPSSRSKGHNRLFAYLVMSVICCWTPNHVYYLWAGITGHWSVPFYTAQFYLSYANSWLNPVLIYLADTQIRKAVNEMVNCR